MKRKYISILSLFLFCFIACKKTKVIEQEKSLTQEATANIEIKETYVLEEEIKAKIVLSNIPVEVNCHITLGNRFADQIIPIETKNGTSNLSLGSFTQSGNLSLSCSCDGEILDFKTTQIQAGPGANKMEAYNGPKSLLSYDDVSSMLVVIPKDKYGNPVKENTEVNFSKQYPNLIQLNSSEKTQNLVAYKITQSIGKSGKILLGANCDNAFIAEQEIQVQATLPKKITIETIEVHPNADSRQNIHIATLPILDVNGNPVADGTKINFIVLNAIGKQAQYASFTINGIARVLIQNPSKAARWQVIATLYGSVFSNILNFHFASFIMPFELELSKNNESLKAGPLSTSLGQLAPDGTIAKIKLLNGTKIILETTAEAVDGFIEYQIPSRFRKMDDINCLIEIGGLKNNIEFFKN